MIPTFERFGISVSGLRQSGKDTVVNYIGLHLKKMDKMNRHIIHISFAEVIKEEFFQYSGLNETIYSANKEMYRPSIQAFAASKRIQNTGYWLGKVFAKINALPHEDTWLIISGAREPVELLSLQKLGFYMWNVNRVIERNLPCDKHANEGYIKQFVGWDSVINNNIALSRLQINIQKLCDITFEQYYGNKKFGYASTNAS